MSNAAFAYILSLVVAATVAISGAAAAEGLLLAQERLGYQGLEIGLSGDEIFSRFIAELLLRLPNFFSPALGSAALVLTSSQVHRQLTLPAGAAFLASSQEVRRLRQWRRLGYTVLDLPFGWLALLETEHKGRDGYFNRGLYKSTHGAVFKVGVKASFTRALFENEWTALVNLCHEGILPVHGWAHADGMFFMISESMDFSLAHIMNHVHSAGLSTLPLVPFTVRWFKDVVRALAYMHTQGWLHRNISPSSVLVNKYGRAILSGFTRATHNVAVKSKERFSDNGYAAPETRTGRWTPSSDVFAACAVLFKVLTGFTPRELLGDGLDLDNVQFPENFDKGAWDVLTDEPCLFALFKAGLSRDPAERPTAAQCALLANEFLEGAGISSVPVDQTDLARSPVVFVKPADLELYQEPEIIEHADADPGLWTAYNSELDQPVHHRSRARRAATKFTKVVGKGFGKLKKALCS